MDGPCPITPGDTEELTLAFKRVVQNGLVNLPQDIDNEETLDVSHPECPTDTIEKLSPTDPRAVDFQNQLRNWCVPDPSHSSQTAQTTADPMSPRQVWRSSVVPSSKEGDVRLALLVSLL